MIIKAEDQRIVKIICRDNGWVSVEVINLDNTNEWKHKNITLMASEIMTIAEYVKNGKVE